MDLRRGQFHRWNREPVADFLNGDQDLAIDSVNERPRFVRPPSRARPRRDAGLLGTA